MYAGNDRTYIDILAQDKFNTYTARNLDRIMGVLKMGNPAPRAGIEPTCFAFWASLLTITPPRLHYPRLPEYVAPFLRGQRRLVMPSVRFDSDKHRLPKSLN